MPRGIWVQPSELGAEGASGARGDEILVQSHEAPEGLISLVLGPGVLPPAVWASVSPERQGMGDSPSVILGSRGLRYKNDCKMLCASRGCPVTGAMLSHRGGSVPRGPLGAALPSEEGPFCSLRSCECASPGQRGPRARCWQPPSQGTRDAVSPGPEGKPPRSGPASAEPAEGGQGPGTARTSRLESEFNRGGGTSANSEYSLSTQDGPVTDIRYLFLKKIGFY